MNTRKLRCSLLEHNMDDMDVFAAMGIAGFGKTVQKKQLDPSRFDKNKRDDVSYNEISSSSSLTHFLNKRVKKAAVGPTAGPSALLKEVETPRSEENESDDDEQGPAPPPAQNNGPEDAEEPFEPEYDPSEDESDLPQFPITHEITLKDHTKVVSALALDPSGARIISGSHDYDCKLWDFGGMDMRCKPFKSWEPAGTYYVRCLALPFLVRNNNIYRSMT